MSLYEASHKKGFFCWVYVKLLKGRVFCCSSMDIKLWQVSSSPVSLKRFSDLCNLPILFFLLPPLHPRYLQGMLYLILRSKNMRSITHHFQNLAALIILSNPHHVTSHVALASAKQTSQRSFPISCHASLSTRGTAQPDDGLTFASTSACLSHNIFAALRVSDPFSYVWQMLWTVLSQQSEGTESTWLSKFSLILLFWGNITGLLKAKPGRHCGLCYLLQNVLSSLLPTYFTSHLHLLLHIHSQGLCPDHNSLSSGLS